MLDAIEAGSNIATFLKDATYEQYLENTLVRLAVERELTIVGEAAKRMSEPFRAAHPEIAWPKVIRLRNVLMHQYDKIDNHRIFVIATELVPKLVEILNGLLPPIPPDPELQDE